MAVSKLAAIQTHHQLAEYDLDVRVVTQCHENMQSGQLVGRRMREPNEELSQVIRKEVLRSSGSADVLEYARHDSRAAAPPTLRSHQARQLALLGAQS